MVIKDTKYNVYYGGRNYRGTIVWTSREHAKRYKNSKSAREGLKLLVHGGIRPESELEIECRRQYEME